MICYRTARTFLFVLAAGVFITRTPLSLEAQQSSVARTTTAEEYAASLPKDVYPDSRSRFPLIKREDLDNEGKKIFDSFLSSDSKSLAGLQGPGGLHLYGSPDRSQTGVDRRLQELARLVVTREMDQAFEWTVHEPVALKQGVEPATIDVIRYRKPLTGVPEKDASVIQLGREIFEKHKVTSATFARVLKQLGRKNLIDLCSFMGSFTNTAILLHTMDAHLPYDRKPLLPISSGTNDEGTSGWRKMTEPEYAASLPKDVFPDSRGRLPLVKREDLDEDGKKAYDHDASPDSTALAGLAGPGGIGLHASPANVRGSVLGQRLQELARLVVARETDQVFEWTVQEPRALEEGLEPEIIDIVRYHKSLDGVAEKEASIIQLGREIFEKHKVSSETFARIYIQLGDRNLVDLCYLMGNYASTSILLHTVDLHLPYNRKPLLPVP
jgi:4-carboxymuconolactone decarboxylase